MSHVKLPSERSFGLLFTVVFALVGGYGLHRGWNTAAVAALFSASALMVLLAMFAPKLLSPLNVAWHKLGLLLGMIVSPIVLGLIFFVLLTPVGLIGRLFGRDELRMKRRNVSSYWVDREPPGPAPDSFKNQF
jgi:predicted membrane metal-binding protein